MDETRAIMDHTAVSLIWLKKFTPTKYLLNREENP